MREFDQFQRLSADVAGHLNALVPEETGRNQPGAVGGGLQVVDFVRVQTLAGHFVTMPTALGTLTVSLKKVQRPGVTVLPLKSGIALKI